ncbi:MAG: uracil-DNA glycosylase [Bacillota bacterium]
MDKRRDERDRINCLKCRHYYITWDRKFPRGCRALDFKSKYCPSAAVYNSSGMPCLFYQERKKVRVTKNSRN